MEVEFLCFNKFLNIFTALWPSQSCQQVMVRACGICGKADKDELRGIRVIKAFMLACY